MEIIKAGSVIILSLRSFGGFSNAKSAGFWGSAPDPDGGASSVPPYPLAGREGCPPPRDGSAYSQPLPFSAPPTVQAGSASEDIVYIKWNGFSHATIAGGVAAS